MDPVSLVIGVFSLADLTLKYGKKLNDMCRTYKAAEVEVAERIFILENRWLKVGAQIEVLHQVWPQLPGRLQIHFNTLCAMINAKLIATTDLLNATIAQQEQGQKLAGVRHSVTDLMAKDGKIRRGAFATKLKSSLDASIRDLDAWRSNLFDPVWYQLVLIRKTDMANIARQTALKYREDNGVIASIQKFIQANEDHKEELEVKFTPAETIELLEYSEVEFSDSKIARDNLSGKLVILDRISVPSQYWHEIATKDVCALSRKLAKLASEDFGLLPCLGVLNNGLGFDLILAFPKGLDEPMNLRRLLLDKEKRFPLNVRVHLAQMLARSIGFLHTCRLVHKNVRPENIICFSANYNDTEIRPYLIGLEQFRHADASSMRLSDNLWYRDIYRHPSRQGAQPEQDYELQHDIYSLGVCLLEIGLWHSFIDYAEVNNANSDRVSPNEAFILRDDLSIRNPRSRARAIQRGFVKKASESLPGLMGQKYTEIVISCLTCLDPSNVDFMNPSGENSDDTDGEGGNDEEEEEEEIMVGLRYIQKVMNRLMSISI